MLSRCKHFWLGSSLLCLLLPPQKTVSNRTRVCVSPAHLCMSTHVGQPCAKCLALVVGTGGWFIAPRQAGELRGLVSSPCCSPRDRHPRHQAAGGASHPEGWAVPHVGKKPSYGLRDVGMAGEALVSRRNTLEMRCKK